MSPQIPSKFTSYAALSAEDGKALKVQKYEFEPQPWTEEDIDVKVECTSICGSCLHTITSGWGKSEYPCTVGHEIVGTVVRAGNKSGHTVGSRVGIGAQGASCGTCEACKSHNENHCIQGVTGTYQGVVDGVVKQGGFADYHRTRGRFAIEIPESLPSETAAPFMCGGATLYNPLVRFGEKKQGLKVGIVGVGGLGHFGLLLGNALGYEMFALSSTASKKEDCIKMGVKEENFWVTSDIEATVKAHSNTLDLIIVASNQKKPPIADLYFPLLKFHGKCIFVGAAEAPFSEISPFAFLGKGVLLGGSMIAPPHQIKEMLDLVAEKKIHAWTQSRPMSELGQALKDMQQGKARYRYVMVNPSN